MYNLLASENTGNLVLIVILLLACALMFVLSYFKNKKYMAQQQDMLNNLEVGSKVLTKTFVYGTVEKITDTTDGKIVLIKTGEDDKVGYMEMNIEGIYSIDNKEEVFDFDSVMEDVETEAVEETAEEKPKRKPRAKKED